MIPVFTDRASPRGGHTGKESSMIGWLVGVLILVLDIIAIVSVLSSGASVPVKLLWVVLILLLPVLGMILYFLLGPGSRSITA
jgi:hypothetical protein